jgi:hypothetical protein
MVSALKMRGYYIGVLELVLLASIRTKAHIYVLYSAHFVVLYGLAVQETEDKGMLNFFVKILTQAAMERGARERELSSTLLVTLVPSPMPTEQLSLGFTRLLSAIDDYVLDVPNAVHLATLFLARAIVDEILPPTFLTSVLDSLEHETLAIEVVRQTGRLLGSPNSRDLVKKVR